MEKSIDELFTEGIELRDNGKLSEATNIFLDIIRLFPEDSKMSGTYSVLGGVYFDLNDFVKSKDHFKKATVLKPESELASLGLYLSYTELGNYDDAIGELKRFLEKYPAKLYEETLKELLEDLNSGYAAKFKETILTLAKKNKLI